MRRWLSKKHTSFTSASGPLAHLLGGEGTEKARRALTMLLKLTHTTDLTYSDLISESTMELRMAPRQEQDQHRLSFTLALGPPAAALSYFDWLANTVHAFTVTSFHKQIRIVAKKALNYTAATDNDVLLDLITNASSDPVKVQIDAWRTQYGADLVSVIRAFDNASQTNCGLAWIGQYHGNPPDAHYGFSAVGDGAIRTRTTSLTTPPSTPTPSPTAPEPVGVTP